MNKKIKILIVLLVSVTVLVSAFFLIRKVAVDFVFDKVYNEVIDEMRKKEKKEASKEPEQGKPAEAVKGEDGEEYVPADETDTPDTTMKVKDEHGVSHVVKKPQTEKKPASTTDVAIKQLSELTNQELQEIQALVTSADKAAAINIVKSALTADDKREIKAMLESGKIDYARCKQIASARLSVAQKKQIYAYYEKYAKIYFANK